MSIVPLSEAKAHLRLEPDFPDAQLAGKLAAAEQRAAHFINRAIFASDTDLQTAIAAVPQQLADAGTAFRAALEAAAALPDQDAALLMKDAAWRAYTAAITAARETASGIVATEDIKAAILLTLGHLFNNVSDVEVGTIVTPMDYGAQYLLMPHRIGWGG